jgi:4'-phosphopantetheinyl transferase
MISTQFLEDATVEAPLVPRLGQDVHVWQVRLDGSDHELSLAGLSRALLSDDESRRADRFRFARDRRRFIAARAALRRILSGYLLCDAAELRFEYAEHGKPGLAYPVSGIRFNVSHSDNLALLAVVSEREIGVDVEQIRADVETDTLAERFFSVAERVALRGLDESARVAAFFRCWTCKEAYLKAKGFGLSVALDSFDVSVRPEEAASLLATRPESEEAARWALQSISTLPGFAAAVAVERPVGRVKTLELGHGRS